MAIRASDDGAAGGGPPRPAMATGMRGRVHPPSSPRDARGARTSVLVACLLELQHNASLLFRQRPAEAQSGFGAVVTALLPADDDAGRQLADALGVDLRALRAVGTGLLDPARLPPDALARFGRTVGLRLDTLAALLRRDHVRFSIAWSGPDPVGAPPMSDFQRALVRLRESWETLGGDP